LDRKRLIRQIKERGIPVAGGVLKVSKELGSGGNGVAFLCRDATGKTLVAKVYIPLDSRDIDDRALERFRTETKLLSALKRHPNVIRALDSGTLKIGAYLLPFYTMPHAKETLRDLIARTSATGELERKLRLFVRASLGVAWLHSHGIIHRDLKPENILIGNDGSHWIADLGIAHVNPGFVSVGVKTIAKEQLFNRDYYAPEQRYEDADKVDHRADIYALGCILYEMLAGTPPVRQNSPPLVKVDTAFEPLDGIIDRMIPTSLTIGTRALKM